jgi:RNA recognition motif-containing protein
MVDDELNDLLSDDLFIDLMPEENNESSNTNTEEKVDLDKLEEMVAEETASPTYESTTESPTVPSPEPELSGVGDYQAVVEGLPDANADVQLEIPSESEVSSDPQSTSNKEFVPFPSRGSSGYSPLSTPRGIDGYGKKGEQEDSEMDMGEGDEGTELETGLPKKKGRSQNPLGENFMDHVWKKPDKELAAKRGKASLWQGGQRNMKDTSVHDFGDMSDGMELYFYVLRAFVGLFFVLTLLSIPLLVIATAGNKNMALENSIFPAAQTLGNVGYNPNTDFAGGYCRDREGINKCISIRYIFGLEVQAKYVTFVISAYEGLMSVTMIGFSIWLLMSVERTADQIDGEVSTPADFTVFVRNLPKDVSESALISHFSMRYALDTTQPRYPIMGYSVFGASLTFGFFAALFLGIIAGGSLSILVAKILGPLSVLSGPVVLIFFTALFTLILWLFNFGGAKDRPTPAEVWDEAERKRNLHREKMNEEREKDKEKIRKYNEKHGKVIPEGLEDAVLEKKTKKGWCGKKKKVDPSLEDIDIDGLGPDMPRPDPKPVSNCLHNGYPPVLGSWVADLHIVYPNGSIISSYLKQKALMGKIQAMRSKIQQFKDDTPFDKGPNPSKVEKFTKKLEKLQKKMSKVHAKVARKVTDTRKAANCEGCFITFQHEESRNRCLEDYRASSSSIGRYFQPRSLQFMWNSENKNTAEKEESWTSLRVEAAPEPSDIFWEKLHVTDTSRLLRVIFSNFVTFTVLLISFSIALLAAVRTKEANAAIASTNYCGHLPAIWYGKYFNETEGDLWDTTNVKWVRNSTKDTTVCGGKGTYIVNEEFDLDVSCDFLF